jgi:hypothetical protein
VTGARDADGVPPTGPRPDTGLVLIRVWIEPDQEGEDALRARIIAADDADDRGVAAAGVENVVAVVRDFLTAFAGQRPG